MTVANPAPNANETAPLSFRIEAAAPTLVYVDDSYGSLPADTPVRAYSNSGEFIGLVNYSTKGYLKAARLMNTAG